MRLSHSYFATEPIKAGDRTNKRKGQVRPRKVENVERTHKDKFSWSRCSIQHVLQCNGSVKD